MDVAMVNVQSSAIVSESINGYGRDERTVISL